VDLEHDIDAILIELDLLGSTVAANRPCRRYSSIIRATSARALERVKIWRGAKRISGRILSSFSRLLPSSTMRLITGFSRITIVSAPLSSRIWTS
jgi:hypothetical protein